MDGHCQSSFAAPDWVADSIDVMGQELKEQPLQLHHNVISMAGGHCGHLCKVVQWSVAVRGSAAAGKRLPLVHEKRLYER